MDTKTKNNRPKMECSILGFERCSKTIIKKSNQVFVAHPYHGKFPVEDYRNTLEELSRGKPFEFVFADKRVESAHILCKICQSIQESCINIFDVSYWNPNVTLELGLAYGLRAKIIIFFNSLSKKQLPSDIRGLDRAQYRSLTELKDKIESIVVPMIPSVLDEKYPFIVLNKRITVERKDYDKDTHKEIHIYRTLIRSTRSGEAIFETTAGTQGKMEKIESLSHDAKNLSVIPRPDGYFHLIRTNLGTLTKGEEVLVETKTIRTVENVFLLNKYVDFEMDAISKDESYDRVGTWYPTNKMEYLIKFPPDKHPSRYIGTLKLIGTRWFEDKEVKARFDKVNRILHWQKDQPEPNVSYMIKWKW